MAAGAVDDVPRGGAGEPVDPVRGEPHPGRSRGATGGEAVDTVLVDAGGL
ncbi:hypothetical protein AB0G55_03440 [Streptomyces toyocaensis]|nr:hypothetical protein [Streptomyces toyocaensis]